MIIILKLQNIHWRQFFYAITLSEHFFLFIERLPNCYSVSSSPFYLYHCGISPNLIFREHISRALPTEMIFYLLLSIPSKSFFIDVYSRELMPHTLEIIIKWLQVSVSKCNRQTPQTEISFVSTRNLVSSDQTTCITASRANFFFTNLSLSLEFDVLIFSVFSYIYIHKLAPNVGRLYVVNTPVSERFS